MDERASQVVVVRHGETQWSLDGRHTGRTDIPLTERGREEARRLAGRLARLQFARVLVSPLQRALETCRLAGFGDVAEVCEDLAEWDYGAYEGETMAEIQTQRPGWSLWDDGPPGGESADDVGRRADRVIAGLRPLRGDALLFAHGHVLRILAARWLALAPRDGRLFALDAAGMGFLGYEHAVPVLARWNEVPDQEFPGRPQGREIPSTVSTTRGGSA
jgi:probable phosphoglycerate mutase